MADDDYCYVTTTGRRSGNPHRIEIWYERDADTVFLMSGSGTSDWVKNIEANASVLVEIQGVVRDGDARVIDDPGQIERARDLVYAKYAPRFKEDLVAWRDSATPIAIALGATHLGEE